MSDTPIYKMKLNEIIRLETPSLNGYVDVLRTPDGWIYIFTSCVWKESEMQGMITSTQFVPHIRI